MLDCSYMEPFPFSQQFDFCSLIRRLYPAASLQRFPRGALSLYYSFDSGLYVSRLWPHNPGVGVGRQCPGQPLTSWVLLPLSSTALWARQDKIACQKPLGAQVQSARVSKFTPSVCCRER